MGVLRHNVAGDCTVGHMPQIDRVQSVIEAQQREFPRLDYSAKAIAARLVGLGTVFIAAIERVAARFGVSARTNMSCSVYCAEAADRSGYRRKRLPP